MKDKITIEFLLMKLSPMADPNDVVDVRERLIKMDMVSLFRREYRGGDYVVFRLKDIWPHLYPKTSANIPRLSRLAASLQANFYERSALNGDLVFVKDVKEYLDFGF